ncbi:hypothetical protein Taro_036628, partial [Colocasia esculenta]|nr:hypothetical protein [Colocasia esculenta]
TNFLCKRCVDTPINGVDTSTQTQREIVQKCQECVDTCQECVDTSGSFPEIKGTQVDTLPGQVDTRPSSQNSQKPLKHLKEVDQVEAIVGEEFKEGPTSQIAEHRLGLHVYKLLPNSSFYKGVHLKNEGMGTKGGTPTIGGGTGATGTAPSTTGGTTADGCTGAYWSNLVRISVRLSHILSIIRCVDSSPDSSPLPPQSLLSAISDPVQSIFQPHIYN